MKSTFMFGPDSIQPSDHLQYSRSDLPIPVKAIRYYLPVEICSNGHGIWLFHYCCYLYPANEPTPVGYCAQNCKGHSSKESAREHYRQYLIDRYAQYTGKLATSSECAICGQMTTHYASLDFHYEWEIAPLCADHLDRVGFAKAFVLHDYHLLQVSDMRSKTIVTFAEHHEPICIVEPARNSTIEVTTQVQRYCDMLPRPQ